MGVRVRSLWWSGDAEKKANLIVGAETYAKARGSAPSVYSPLLNKKNRINFITKGRSLTMQTHINIIPIFVYADRPISVNIFNFV